jgi:hypothetical protein
MCFFLRLTAISSEQALDTVRKSTSLSTESLKSYKLLQEYVSTIAYDVTTSQEESLQNMNLVSLLKKIRDRTWSDIKASLFVSVL